MASCSRVLGIGSEGNGGLRAMKAWISSAAPTR